MENKIIFKSMLDTYNANSASRDYLFGYTHKGNIYMATCNESILPHVIKLDKASRGAGYSLRFKPNKAQKELLNLQNTICLCSVAYFNALCSESKYNKGEVFEKLVTEHFGQTWTKDNVPFYMAGDITLNGVEFQIKFENATFCTEKSLANIAR